MKEPYAEYHNKNYGYYDARGERRNIESFRKQWENDIQRILKDEGLKGIRRHARVSLNNRHRCQQCFCCYCMEWLERNNYAY